MTMITYMYSNNIRHYSEGAGSNFSKHAEGSSEQKKNVLKFNAGGLCTDSLSTDLP